MAEKMVVVPQRMLDEIEISRKRLYEIFPDMGIGQQVQMQIVTDPMWRIANTKWEEANTTSYLFIIVN